MVARLKRVMSIDKIDILMSTVAESTRSKYKGGWAAWREFCEGLEVSPKLDPTVPDWGSRLLDCFAWEHKIMGVGYSGLVTRYAAIRFVHLVEGCDFGKAAFRVKSFLKAIKRMNPVTKKAPVTVELLLRIHANFIDSNCVSDLQLWAALMIGFFFCLRISEIQDLGENDLVFQSNPEGNALTIRIRKSKTDQEGQCSLRSPPHGFDLVSFVFLY